MLTLYGIFTLMLFCALGLVAIPFVAHKELLSKKFCGVFLLTVFFSFGLYFFSGHIIPLKQWLEQGQAHYQLLEKLKQLGGLEAVITRIHTKLDTQPTDVQGWLILGKLYLAIHRDHDALIALERAHALEPNNPDITHFYNIAKKNHNP